ncbi:hypothetical protein CBR_g46699 [Chara braunii]|uniref:Uncharacterized protein n=1 Tax=Chara braunii TaxID=69332 RepID=A0A388K3V4_CHABU|nr:hypothetical protein CBR_g46699 [Chara braunii]|eukprot:GBG64742.1 hypothetical protein CBR_g46699 [Chara braunii]
MSAAVGIADSGMDLIRGMDQVLGVCNLLRPAVSPHHFHSYQERTSHGFRQRPLLCDSVGVGSGSRTQHRDISSQGSHLCLRVTGHGHGLGSKDKGNVQRLRQNSRRLCSLAASTEEEEEEKEKKKKKTPCKLLETNSSLCTGLCTSSWPDARCPSSPRSKPLAIKLSAIGRSAAVRSVISLRRLAIERVVGEEQSTLERALTGRPRPLGSRSGRLSREDRLWSKNRSGQTLQESLCDVSDLSCRKYRRLAKKKILCPYDQGGTFEIEAAGERRRRGGRGRGRGGRGGRGRGGGGGGGGGGMGGLSREGSRRDRQMLLKEVLWNVVPDFCGAKSRLIARQAFSAPHNGVAVMVGVRGNGRRVGGKGGGGGGGGRAVGDLSREQSMRDRQMLQKEVMWNVVLDFGHAKSRLIARQALPASYNGGAVMVGVRGNGARIERKGGGGGGGGGGMEGTVREERRRYVRQVKKSYLFACRFWRNQDVKVPQVTAIGNQSLFIDGASVEDEMGVPLWQDDEVGEVQEIEHEGTQYDRVGKKGENGGGLQQPPQGWEELVDTSSPENLLSLALTAVLVFVVLNILWQVLVAFLVLIITGVKYILLGAFVVALLVILL